MNLIQVPHGSRLGHELPDVAHGQQWQMNADEFGNKGRCRVPRPLGGA